MDKCYALNHTQDYTHTLADGIQFEDSTIQVIKYESTMLSILPVNIKLDYLFPLIVFFSVFSVLSYFAYGFAIHWYYYIKRFDSAKEWKLQPDKWVSYEEQKNMLKLGTFSIASVGAFWGFFICYLFNKNPSRMYYTVDEYGWIWFFLQTFLIFIIQDYVSYLNHRLYHVPYMYKKFHKVHHQFKYPTVFCIAAVHPVEVLHVTSFMVLPIFLFPVHFIPFSVTVVYTFHQGLLEHSGINFKAQWWQPWQPDVAHHDQHHQFFNYNFALNIFVWDWIHGTHIRSQKRNDLKGSQEINNNINHKNELKN